MRTLKLPFGLLLLICFFSFQSCSKSSDPGPTPAPVVADTLTSGWSKVVIPGETGLDDIFFNSSTTGYLLGSKIYKSTDGGLTWAPVYTNSASHYNAFMTPDGKAFFVGSSNLIVKTIDGGANFTGTIFPFSPYDIFFSDNNTGFCSTADGLYTTTDGGVTWTKVITTGLALGPSYTTLSFINNTTGWITIDQSIFKTNGSITNWQLSTITGGSGTTQFTAITAPSPSIVYAVKANGEVFKSTNGGTNFSLISQVNAYGFADVGFVDNLNGFISNGNRVFKTIDGGVNWTKVASLGQSTVSELHFTDANHGWVCANNGVVLVFKQ